MRNQYWKISRKFQNIWQLNNRLLSNSWVKEEIKRETRKHMQLNKNEVHMGICGMPLKPSTQKGLYSTNWLYQNKRTIQSTTSASILNTRPGTMCKAQGTANSPMGLSPFNRWEDRGLPGREPGPCLQVVRAWCSPQLTALDFLQTTLLQAFAQMVRGPPANQGIKAQVLPAGLPCSSPLGPRHHKLTCPQQKPQASLRHTMVVAPKKGALPCFGWSLGPDCVLWEFSQPQSELSHF